MKTIARLFRRAADRLDPPAPPAPAYSMSFVRPTGTTSAYDVTWTVQP